MDDTAREALRKHLRFLAMAEKIMDECEQELLAAGFKLIAREPSEAVVEAVARVYDRWAWDEYNAEEWSYFIRHETSLSKARAALPKGEG